MGRSSKKDIEGNIKMKRFFFIFLFFFAVNALSQEMKLQEEIVGKDLSIKKTEIFPHSIPEVKLQLPSPPLLKIPQTPFPLWE